MQEYSPEIATKDGKVRCVTMVLEGAKTRWMVTLYNDDALEQRNFNHFMATSW